MSIETRFAFGPSDIFGENAIVFFSALIKYVNENQGQIATNDSQEMAFIHLPEYLLGAWKKLSRSEEKIVDNLIKKRAEDADWRTASLSEVRGVESTLQLTFYL